MASIVAAHMAQQNEGNVGHPVTEPASTMTSKVCHQNVVTSHMLTLRQNGFGQPIDEPLSTFCAAGNHRPDEHTSELQSLNRISYSVFCLTQQTLSHYICSYS